MSAARRRVPAVVSEGSSNEEDYDSCEDGNGELNEEQECDVEDEESGKEEDVGACEKEDDTVSSEEEEEEGCTCTESSMENVTSCEEDDESKLPCICHVATAEQCACQVGREWT